MTTAGVTYTSTPPLADIAVHDPPATATELWKELVDTEDGSGLGGVLIDSVRELVDGCYLTEAHDVLEEIVDDALDGALVDVLTSFARGSDDPRFWRAASVLSNLGSGYPMGFNTNLDDCRAALGPLTEVERTPTVVIRLPQGFREVNAETRRSWCRLIAALGTAADVRLVCSGVEQAWLADAHRDELPGVSDRGDSTLDQEGRSEALDLVTVGSRHARTLTLLAEEDTETLAYTRLSSQFSVGRSRVRQVVGKLGALGLVETFGSSQERRVELTAAGRKFYDDEIAVQRRLGERVSESGKLSTDSRVDRPPMHGETGDRPDDAPPDRPDRHRLPSHHEVRYCHRRMAASALGTALEGDLNVVNYPITEQDDRVEGRWHYDGDDRLLVSAEGDNPMTVWTTLALSMADRRTFDRVLTKERLADHDVLDMLVNGKSVLRGMRNIGWLPNEVTDYDELRDAFLDAAQELGELTKRLHDSDDDDLRGPITRHALGLAGALSQLLDLADIEIVRAVKFPNYSQRKKESQAEDLFESLAIGTAISSNYNHHVAYRQLFEPRTDKRDQAIDPTIDASNPWARPVGSWVLVGDFAGKTESVADSLREQFDGLDVHSDAPEMAIRSEIVTEPTRRQVACTAQTVLAAKDLKLTPEATSLLHGLARTPFDVADALSRLSGEENDGRRVDAAEIRYALSQLDRGRLLRGFDGRCTTPRELISTLLSVDERIPKEMLADLAGVSERSMRTHLDDMEEVGLVDIEDGRIRLQVSFRSTGGDTGGDDATPERYRDTYPKYVSDPETSPSVHAAAKALRVGREHHGPGDPVESPGWPYTGVTSPPDLRELSSPRPWIDDILPALWGIKDREEYQDDLGVAPALSTVSIRAGPEIEQSALTPRGGPAATGGVADD